MAAASSIEALAQLDDRDVRALTRTMTVCETEPELLDEQVAVYSSHYDDGQMVTNRYVVDATVPTCDCPDMIHRRPADGCQHVRRVQYERGERTIPAGIKYDAVDDGLHIDSAVSA